jgi:predicted Zn-dependent protease with MMP-like domain
MAPDLADFEALAAEAFANLPASFRNFAGAIAIVVAEFPDEDAVEGLGLESDFDLLGLFEGVGMAQASAVPETGAMPNRISLYRRPILDYWAEHHETLGALITHVLVHEIGHHFGLSDDDIEALEAETD